MIKINESSVHVKHHIKILDRIRLPTFTEFHNANSGIGNAFFCVVGYMNQEILVPPLPADVLPLYLATSEQKDFSWFKRNNLLKQFQLVLICSEQCQSCLLFLEQGGDATWIVVASFSVCVCTRKKRQ